MKDTRDTTTEYFKEWQNMKLSDASRARMHKELMEYADFHAATQDVRMVEDGRSIEHAPQRGALSVFKLSFMPYLLLIAILVGGGTSYAAEGSLPGDLLYPVKTEVNESVRSALALSTEAEVALQSELVAERLREAEALEAEGRFSGEAAATVATNLRRHAAAAGEALKESEESETLALGASITANLERFNALVTHDATLAVDLSTVGRTGADGSFTATLATGEIAIGELEEMTTTRLNSLSTVVANYQDELSAEAYAEFSTKLNTAIELSAAAEAEADIQARETYNDISELLGEVEARLSTLGTVEIDSDNGTIVDIDFSRVPPRSIEEEMGGDVTVTSSPEEAVDDSEPEAADGDNGYDPIIESGTDVDVEINSSGPGVINIEGSGSVRSGLGL